MACYYPPKMVDSIDSEESLLKNCDATSTCSTNPISDDSFISSSKGLPSSFLIGLSVCSSSTDASVCLLIEPPISSACSGTLTSVFNSDVATAKESVVAVMTSDDATTSTLSPLSSVSSDVCCLPAAKDAVYFANVSINSLALKPSLTRLVPEIRKLSLECFELDVTAMINKSPSGWKINLLVSLNETVVFGWLVYRIHGEGNSIFSIGNIAVDEKFRKHGYGSRLIREAVAFAKKHPTVEFIGLSSLKESVAFYKRLGFRSYDDVQFKYTIVQEGADIVPGQVYMERRVKTRKQKKTVASQKYKNKW